MDEATIALARIARQQIDELVAENFNLKAKLAALIHDIEQAFIGHHPSCDWIRSCAWVEHPGAKPCSCPKSRVDAAIDAAKEPTP